MIYVVTQGQAIVKDMGVLRGKSTGGYRTRSKRHTSNIENKTQTDRDEPDMTHHQPQTQASATARGSN
jgi:hypothetical protein